MNIIITMNFLRETCDLTSHYIFCLKNNAVPTPVKGIYTYCIYMFLKYLELKSISATKYSSAVWRKDSWDLNTPSLHSYCEKM